MSRMHILGICLLRNEEHFVAWSLMNIADFCDEIIVLNNKSEDRTPEILEALSRRLRHVRVVEVDDAYDTHKFVEGLAGKNYWVLGVDGDEIYDPAGLARLRPRMLAGEFNASWRIVGHALHVERIDWETKTAFGYGQPEARSITKLYNFSAITSWRQKRHQRLHGKSMEFRPGYSPEAVRFIWNETPWAASDFRCLHMCFVPRSPLEEMSNGRANPSEVMKSKTFLRRAGQLLGIPRWDSGRKQSYKQRFYAQGPVQAAGITAFGRPRDWQQFYSGAEAVEQLFRPNGNRDSKKSERIS